jgi:hypothetical protein
VTFAGGADAAKLVAPDAPAEAIEMDGRKLNIRYAEALGQPGRVGRGEPRGVGLYGDPARGDYRDRDPEKVQHNARGDTLLRPAFSSSSALIDREDLLPRRASDSFFGSRSFKTDNVTDFLNTFKLCYASVARDK